MNSIRVFPVRTSMTPDDDLAFIGYPPLFRPKEDLPVKISVTFTWDKPEAEKLKKAWADYYSGVQIGGPAYGDSGGEFTPGMFLKKGVTTTSRDCPKKCDFCYVPKREGQIRELEIKDGWIIQDNNLLGCSKQHIENVFAMLCRQPHPASFTGGLDAIYLEPWHRELFDSIRIKELWFACDSLAAIKHLERAAKILDGISMNKLRCYVLIGFSGESLEGAEDRLRKVFNLGFLPFAQLYRTDSPSTHNKEWRILQRQWSRPAIYKSIMKETHKLQEKS